MDVWDTSSHSCEWSCTLELTAEEEEVHWSTGHEMRREDVCKQEVHDNKCTGNIPTLPGSEPTRELAGIVS